MEGSQPRWSFPSGQTVVGVVVAAFAAILVLYPIFFLLQASLDVGDPETRPNGRADLFVRSVPLHFVRLSCFRSITSRRPTTGGQRRLGRPWFAVRRPRNSDATGNTNDQ